MSDSLIIVGLLLVVIGLVAKIGFKLPLLPGDIYYKSDSVTFYFPIVTSIIISIILTFLFNKFRK